eukprot:GILK01007090.1.p1 GENE.GILK01007090.1~~GILK01007090.1.p1  ORF type:complete len:275 (+),score=45.66 GILK01007090.1:206-1030(+)
MEWNHSDQLIVFQAIRKCLDVDWVKLGERTRPHGRVSASDKSNKEPSAPLFTSDHIAASIAALDKTIFGLKGQIAPAVSHTSSRYSSAVSPLGSPAISSSISSVSSITNSSSPAALVCTETATDSSLSLHTLAPDVKPAGDKHISVEGEKFVSENMALIVDVDSMSDNQRVPVLDTKMVDFNESSEADENMSDSSDEPSASVSSSPSSSPSLSHHSLSFTCRMGCNKSFVSDKARGGHENRAHRKRKRVPDAISVDEPRNLRKAPRKSLKAQEL